MRKKTLLIFLTVLFCFSSGFAQGNQETGNEDQQITLRFSWWGSEDRHEATIAAIEKYEELNPNITIEYEYMGFDSYYQKLLTQLAGGPSLRAEHK